MDKIYYLKPEEKARVKIDKQLDEVGWDIVDRDTYNPNYAQAVREALMLGSKESDYLFFIDNKAIAVLEAKREENPLDDKVATQAENYAKNPEKWYGFWVEKTIPLVYLANGKKIYFKNMLIADSDYVEIPRMHSPKKMLQIINKTSTYGALPKINKNGLRDCQFRAEKAFENSLINGKKRALAVLTTGAGKTYLACLASYRLLNYTPIKRILFLVDRNNLGKQTENEFNLFDRTENGKSLSALYSINRLRKNDDINGTIVISTIQKLFAVLTGNKLIGDDNDEDDDYLIDEDDSKYENPVDLGDKITLPHDYFQFIVVDECHRSIYGKWRSVLNYFNDAIILGLTATPTEEAYAFFDKNIVEKYTYEDSVIDGVNVPFRVFDIKTRITYQGAEISKNTNITQIVKKTGKKITIKPNETVIYTKEDLDRTVIDREQIKTVLETYRDSIYADLYPEREEKWEYIPKTLIFAKNDKHADEIISAINKVFKGKFANNVIPDGFAQKITYSAGDSNQLIKNFRNDKNFRIAVTVTLVATGTDIKQLEVVMFMADVRSDVLYTQMKGRGCRTINDDKLKEVTPNAECKDCFYVVDAVGATQGEKTIPHVSNRDVGNKLQLEDLLEHISHGEISDENLNLLKDYCSSITNRYKNNPLIVMHLDEFIKEFGYSPVYISEKIKEAMENNVLPDYLSPSEPNTERFNLISKLIYNNEAKNKLLELKKGYISVAPFHKDEVIYKGFSIETARDFIKNFEKYLYDHKDSIEALRIIYNSEDKLITYSMLCDLRDKLLAANGQYTPYFIWKNYKRLDNEGKVEELDQKRNLNALTNLIQLARYAYKKNNRLFNLFGIYAQRFNLYVGNTNHKLTDVQIDIMHKIGDYIVEEGTIGASELNTIDTDLWRKGITSFGQEIFGLEIQMLSKYIIGVA